MAPAANAESESARLARMALFAFILTFIAARIMVLLIMARRVPNLYFFLHGTHVHHLNYGIFLLAGVGTYLLLRLPTGRSLRGGALAYGIALALTFDEFGMWLHLGGTTGSARAWTRSSWSLQSLRCSATPRPSAASRLATCGPRSPCWSPSSPSV